MKNFQIKYHFPKIFSVSLVLKCWFINVPNVNQMVDTVPAQAIDNAARLGRGVALFARARLFSNSNKRLIFLQRLLAGWWFKANFVFGCSVCHPGTKGTLRHIVAVFPVVRLDHSIQYWGGRAGKVSAHSLPRCLGTLRDLMACKTGCYILSSLSTDRINKYVCM